MSENLSNAFIENTLLLENLQGGIVFSDFNPPFHLRYVTEGLARMSGYTQEELLAMQQMDLVWDADIDMLTFEVANQLSRGDTFDVEYRLKRKDGTYIYILDRAKVVSHEDGNKYIHCLLTDITKLKLMEQALRMSEEKYKLAINQSGNVILEYNLNSQMLVFSDNFIDVFGYAPPQKLLDENWLAPESTQTLIDLFEYTVSQSKSSTIELLVRSDGCDFAWASLALSPVVVSDGQVHALVGCLNNIDKHKRKVAELLDLSQRDGLTNIFNRVTMETMITEHLQDECTDFDAALIVMDIDYFKEVNDNFGHETGDRILVSLAQIVANTLPPGALFGRLGGDEFLIFVPVVSEEALAQLCGLVTTTVSKAFANDECHITVSLGGALCDSSSKTFRSLYRSADTALYGAKNNGRNQYKICDK